MLGLDELRITSHHGEYVVPVDGEDARGPVVYPVDLVARDVGFGIDTAPEGLRGDEHMRLDATLYDTAVDDAAVGQVLQPGTLPVDGEIQVASVAGATSDETLQAQLRGEFVGPVAAGLGPEDASAPTGSAVRQATTRGALHAGMVETGPGDTPLPTGSTQGSARSTGAVPSSAVEAGAQDEAFPGDDIASELGAAALEPVPGRAPTLRGPSGFVAPPELTEEELALLRDAEEEDASPPNGGDDGGGGGGGSALRRGQRPALHSAGSEPKSSRS